MRAKEFILKEEILNEVDWNKVKSAILGGVLSLSTLGAPDLQARDIETMSGEQIKQYVIQKGIYKNQKQLDDLVKELDKAYGPSAAPVTASPVTPTTVKPTNTPTAKDIPVHTGKWKKSKVGGGIDSPDKDVYSVTSNNSINFDFPYGKTNMNLHVRLQNGKLDPMGGIFIQSAGQFYDGGSNEVKIKFDNLPAETYRYGGPTDGSSGVAFIFGGDQFLKKLANSKKIKIQISYYQAGYQIFEFDTEGLNTILQLQK